MKSIALFTVVFFLSLPVFSSSTAYPTSPNPALTPGSLCEQPDNYYYDEHVPHCRRDVSSGLKNRIIDQYDDELGFNIARMDRRAFKIDHYIPLCMGGSNNQNNLWPQHQSVFKITDPLEQTLCEMMAQGKILQQEAIELVKAGKADLSLVEKIIDELQTR